MHRHRLSIQLARWSGAGTRDRARSPAHTYAAGTETCANAKGEGRSPTSGLLHLRHAQRRNPLAPEDYIERPTPVASVMHPIEYSTGVERWEAGSIRNGPQAR